MPLVRRNSPMKKSAKNGGGERGVLMSPDPEQRRRAVRSMAGEATAIEPLVAQLRQEPDHQVREAIFTAMLRMPSDLMVEALVPLLRDEAPALRSGALEVLQARVNDVVPYLPELLSDADPDVRILSVEITRSLTSDQATALLNDLLRGETQPNVCAAAVDVLSEVGTKEALPVLEDLQGRFSGEAFLPFAIATAIRRISGLTS